MIIEPRKRQHTIIEFKKRPREPACKEPEPVKEIVPIPPIPKVKGTLKWGPPAQEHDLFGSKTFWDAGDYRILMYTPRGKDGPSVGQVNFEAMYKQPGAVVALVSIAVFPSAGGFRLAADCCEQHKRGGKP